MRILCWFLFGAMSALPWGCGEADRSAPAEGDPVAADPEPATHTDGKLTAGLALEFVEPAEIRPGEELPFALHIGGRPSQSVTVRLLGSAGVSLSGYSEPTPVALDTGGEATISFRATTRKERGCYIVAHVSTGDGRTQEARCLIGGPPEKAHEKPDRGVRIDPSTDR